MKKYFAIFIRVFFAAAAIAIVCWTVRRTDAHVADALIASRKWWLLMAVCVYGFMQIVAGWRWLSLLKIQGMTFNLFEMFRLTLIGCFFSLFLPGTVSGDVFKVAFASARYPEHKTELALSVLADRIVGLCGMFFAGVIAMLMVNYRSMLDLLADSWYVRFAAITVVGGCLAIPIAFLVLRRGRSEFWQNGETGIPRDESRMYRLICLLPAGIRQGVIRCLQALDLYGNTAAIPVLISTLAWSVVIHLFHANVLFSVGRALGENNLSACQYNVVMQLSNVTSLIPLFPGGIGLRDYVVSDIMTWFAGNSAGNACVPVVYTFILVFWGIVGAVLWCSSPALRRTAEKGRAAGHEH